MRDAGGILDQAYELVAELLGYFVARPFGVRLPDGRVIPPKPANKPPSFTLVLNRPGALRRMFLPPNELAMGESYIFNDYDIEGDVVAAFNFMATMAWPKLSVGQLARLGWRLWQLERMDARPGTFNNDTNPFTAYEETGQQDNKRDKRAIQFTYNASNDFYRLWLHDTYMQYTCAYFLDKDEPLDVAQKRKLDLICRKLKLRPGERLLDIGCGWGGLIRYAAAHYGVNAVGVTLSESQRDEGMARIQAEGLADRCRVEVCHYEEYVDKPFDKVASIGMFEHVGERRLGGYFAKVNEFLKAGGLFLLQGGLVREDRRHAGKSWMDRLGLGRNAFMQKYSFPDSHLVNVPFLVGLAEAGGFELLGAECLRPSYPITIQHWLQSLEEKREAAIEELGSVAYRAWRIMLAGYGSLLERGDLTEYQFLLSRPGEAPLTQSPLHLT